jgi:hypothetical protein
LIRKDLFCIIIDFECLDGKSGMTGFAFKPLDPSKGFCIVEPIGKIPFFEILWIVKPAIFFWTKGRNEHGTSVRKKKYVMLLIKRLIYRLNVFFDNKFRIP